MILSYSGVSKWDTCQRQYYYGFTLGLKAENVSEALNTGIIGHRLLQAFYTSLQEGKNKIEALKLTQRMAAKIVADADFTSSAEILKSWTLVDNFIRGNEFPLKAALVENRFLVPFSIIAPVEAFDMNEDLDLDDVQIGFTPDVVFERQGGYYDVEDAKFIGRAWSKSRLDRFTQAKLYQIFLKRLGYDVRRSSVRFFNTTTYKITTHTETMEPAEEETILRDFISAVIEVVRFENQELEDKKQARRTQNNMACQFCSFELPCGMEARGNSAEKTLKYLYVKNEYDYSK